MLATLFLVPTPPVLRWRVREGGFDDMATVQTQPCPRPGRGGRKTGRHFFDFQ